MLDYQMKITSSNPLVNQRMSTCQRLMCSLALLKLVKLLNVFPSSRLDLEVIFQSPTYCWVKVNYVLEEQGKPKEKKEERAMHERSNTKLMFA